MNILHRILLGVLLAIGIAAPAAADMSPSGMRKLPQTNRTPSIWMAAASRGETAYGVGSISSASFQRHTCRNQVVLGNAAYDALAVVDGNYWVDATNVEQATSGAGYTQQRAIEIPGAPTPVVRVTWSAATSVAVTPGTAKVTSDPVYPYQFGLSTFTRGLAIWHRRIIDYDVTSNNVPQTPVMGTAGTNMPTGESCVSSATSVDQLMTQGALSAGAGVVTVAEGLPLVTIGLSANPARSYLIVGDSIAQGFQDDAAGDGRAGGGPFRRALYGLGYPWANISRSSTQASQFTSNAAKRLQIAQYFSDAIDEYGTNDLQASIQSPAIITSKQANAALLKAQGVQRIYHSTIIPRTNASNVASGLFLNSSTNGRPTLNTSLVAAVGASWNFGLMDTSAALQDATGEVWLNYATDSFDGTHTKAAGAAKMAAPVTLYLPVH